MLCVWLPLNGNLHNQGLSNINITNNGATINNNGKIGKCYQFGTAVSDITLSATAMTSCTTECSVAFWINILTWNSSWATFFQAGIASTAWEAYRFGLLRNNAASTCCFTISNGSSTSQTSYLTPAFDLNKWYHVALIYKTGHCLIYINGELYKDYSTSIVPNFAGITTIKLGHSTYENYYQTNCLMNDFRIYNNALSAKEVEEIAKGLVLHYKLDQNLNVLNNCYNYPTFNTSSASGGWYHWGPSGNAGTYGQNTDKQYIFNKTNTYSHWVDNTASATGKYFICYQSPAFSGGFRSLQCIVKEANSLPITEDICYPGWNARNGGAPTNIWTKISPLGDGFYLCQVNGLSQDGSNNLVSIEVRPGYKIYISEGYLENDREICSDIFNQNNLTTIYDCSGYNNNGEQSNITIITPSPRYSIATNFSNSAYIKVTDNKWMAQGIKEMTINLWAKTDSWPTSGHLFSCTESGGFNLEAGSSGYWRFPVHVYTDSAQSSTAYKYDSQEIKISELPINEWVMFTLIYDGAETKTYLNGELHHTYTNISYGIHFNTNARLFLACEANSANPTSPYFTGQLSDFRIYNTALTEKQIKELYNISMTIDNQGNIHARELVE